MAPSTNIAYASLYDTTVDDEGQTYIAKYRDGEMAWVLLTEPLGCPEIPACLMNVGFVLIGTDKKEYIVKESNTGRYWSLKQKDNKKKPGNKGFPSTDVEEMNVGDVLVGVDGHEYIVKEVKGRKQYVLYQKIHKWSKSGALYKTLDTTSLDDGCHSNGRTQKHRRRPNRKA